MYEVMRDYDSEWDGFDNHEIIVESLMDLASGVAVGGGSVKDTAKKVNYSVVQIQLQLLNSGTKSPTYLISSYS